MSSVKVQGNASGTGIFTITSPNSNNTQTLTLPDATTTLLGSNSTQVCQAWVNFNGTTSPGTIRTSYNVSSVTKNGTGDYTVNFTNTLASADYAVAGSNTNSGQTGALLVYGTAGGTPTTMTTGAVRVYSTAGNLALDSAYVAVVVFR